MLYRVIQVATSPLWLPLLALHPRLRGGLRERFGRIAAPLPEHPVWLHGSSAGDVAALQPLAVQLRQRGYQAVVSAWTRAGEQMARRLCQGDASVMRAPLDLPGPVLRVLSRLRPRLLVLECLEMWPQLLSGCVARGVPVAVVNGRLSERSLRWYERLHWIFRPGFASLAYVSALTQEEAARFERAGTPASRIEVRTSSKHAGLHIAAAPRTAPVRLVLGSVHTEEEAPLLNWLERLWRTRPFSAVIAPRYPGRSRVLRRLLACRGFTAELASRGARADAPGRIEILDSIGELRQRYRGANLAFVGGSLTPRGGHNLLEPAAAGVPVLFGPSTEHCRSEATALCTEGAGFEVHDVDDLVCRSQALLGDEAAWQRASQAGLRVATTLAQAVAPLTARLASLAREVVT